MQNVIKAQKTVSEEELKKIREMDWNAYYNESAPPDMQRMENCPDCSAIIMVRQDQSEITCYSCKKQIKPNAA